MRHGSALERISETPLDSTTQTISVLVTVLAYLLGSLSFAVIVSRAMGLADPRSYGSKNPGATNVLRSGNRAAAIITLALAKFYDDYAFTGILDGELERLNRIYDTELARLWPAVGRVADRFIDSGRIDHAEIAAILQGGRT